MATCAMRANWLNTTLEKDPHPLIKGFLDTIVAMCPPR
jgi:hypothetical protein